MSTLTSLLRAFTLLCLLSAPLHAAPSITEFLANNNNGLADEDGSRQDWIEIHNPDAAVLNLAGYTLTDDSTEPSKWTFPDGATISPGGYLVVFASGKDKAVAGSTLHTSFNLASGGEYLGLYSPTAAMVFDYGQEYPGQNADVSYGTISTTPGSLFAFFSTPTPGAANDTAPAPASPVAFSVTSKCFVTGSPPTVALSVASPSATIRYTLNRSVPTATSTLYTGPITLSNATSLSPCTTSGSQVVTVPNVTGMTTGMRIRGTGIPAGATITSIDSPTQITISAPVTQISTATDRNAGGIELSPCTTSGSRIVTAPNTTGLTAGMVIRGTGMPPGATVASVDTLNQFTISANVTAISTTAILNAGGTELSPCTATSNSRVVTVPSTAGLAAAMTIIGTAMPANATITSVDSATQITISANATFTSGAAALVAGAKIMNPAVTRGSRVVVVPSTAGLAATMTMIGTGMPAGATITSVDNATQITISIAATSISTAANLIAGSKALNPSTTTGLQTVTVPNTAALIPGISITGSGMPQDAFIASIDSPTQITVSAPVTAISANATLSVYGSTRIRARAFEPGFPDGPVRSEAYFEMDANAASFTSNLPILVTNSWGTAIPITDVAIASFMMLFEPKAPDNLARLTNMPDRAMPCSQERRGSSTLGDPKYSMALELWDESNNDRNRSMLDMPSESDWVLHAPYSFDRAAMRNDLIYKLSNDFGVYAPRTRFVEQFHNTTIGTGVIQGAVFTTPTNFGDYFGIYSFMEKLSRGEDRVDVEQLSQTDNLPPAVTGGYMFKVDRLDTGDGGLFPITPQTFGGVGSIGYVYPKERSTIPAQVATTEQKNFIRGYIGTAYSSLIASNYNDPVNGYAKYFDVEETVDNHIMNVATKNIDAMRLSAYWYKTREGPLVAGPLWDFDRTQGSTDGRDLNPLTWRGDGGDLGTDFFHYPWYLEMFRDVNFWQLWVDRLDVMRRGVFSTAHVHATIDAFAAEVNLGDGGVATVYDSAAKRNGRRWVGFRGVAGTAVNNCSTTAGSRTVTMPSSAGMTAGPYAYIVGPGLPGGTTIAVVNGPTQITISQDATATASPVSLRINSTTAGTDGTFMGEVQMLKNWWQSRLNFMDGQFIRPPISTPPGGPVTAGTQVTMTSPSLATAGTKIYYTLDGTDPRPFGNAPLTPVTLQSFISEASPIRAVVPTSLATGGATGVEWRGADTNGNGNNLDDFDDASWLAGAANGVGYDDAVVPENFLTTISVRWNTMDLGNSLTGRTAVPPQDATNTMRQCTNAGNGALSLAGNPGCYVRIPFTVSAGQLASAVAPNKLMLRVRYADGFAAFLNGVELTAGRSNAPIAASLTFSSAATANRVSSQGLSFTEFDVTAQMSALHAGNNVLAIHGLNQSVTNTDFVLQPVLIIRGVDIIPPTASAAIEYTGPITINAPAHLFARTVINGKLPSDPPTTGGGGTGSVPNGTVWSAPLQAVYFPGASSGTAATVAITEVNYHPPPPSTAEEAAGFTNSNDFEFIRITNTGAVPVDLTGCYFDDGLEFTFPPALVNLVQPGGSVVLVENLAAFQLRYGSNTFTVAGRFRGELSDSGERIELMDKNGVMIADFTYNDNSPWPELADGERSLIYTGGPQADPASWRASFDIGGSGVNTYAKWQRRHFSDTEIPLQGPGQDDDGDSLNNYGEYSWGTNPRVAGENEHSIARVVGGAFQSTRRKGATDITWTFQSADALTPWAPAGITPTTVDNGDGSETVSWLLNQTGQRKQFRLRASQ